MLTCTLSKKDMERLSAAVQEKNELSLLNRFVSKEFTEEDKNHLHQIGFIDAEGNFLNAIRPTISILSNPYAIVKMRFTGGASIFEHSINYDDTFNNYVSLTMTPEDICIDDISKPNSIIKILKDFIGISNLKSINISGKYNIYEALVIASIMDIERRSVLRAFIDEIPVAHNSYSVNMIWRIINSTSPSIQWFVSIISDIIGTHQTVSLQHVKNGIEGLVEKGVLIKNGEQYQCTGEMEKLPERMIVVDNILSAHIYKMDDEKNIITTGFTCIQSGVHDLLFMDYDGTEISFESVTSASLLECIEQFINGNTIFSL